MQPETRGGLNAWKFQKHEQEVNFRVGGQLTLNIFYAILDGFRMEFVPNSLADA